MGIYRGKKVINQLWEEDIRDDTMYEIYLRKTIENVLMF